MRLHPLAYEILSLLTWCFRCVTESQLSEGLEVPPYRIQRAVRSLREAGLVSSKWMNAPEFKLDGPLAKEPSGEASPELGRVAWELERRWQHCPRRGQRVLWATRLATYIVGGIGGKLRQPLQAGHDLGVAQVYFGYAIRDRTNWVSEDIYRFLGRVDSGDKVPDALLIDGDRCVKRAIEFGGRYSAKRLSDFHHYWWTTRAIPYEIW